MKRKFLLLILSMVTLVPVIAVCQNDLAIVAGKNIAIVQTESGKVRGYIHNGIYTFKGIPYANAARFTPAEKPASWTGVRSSMTYGPVCPTNATTTVNDEFEFPFHHDWGYSNENCLNLNIW